MFPTYTVRYLTHLLSKNFFKQHTLESAFLLLDSGSFIESWTRLWWKSRWPPIAKDRLKPRADWCQVFWPQSQCSSHCLTLVRNYRITHNNLFYHVLSCSFLVIWNFPMCRPLPQLDRQFLRAGQCSVLMPSQHLHNALCCHTELLVSSEVLCVSSCHFYVQ